MDSQNLHHQDFRPTDGGPLRGVRVIDISRLVAVNMVSHLLADFGAEVIKVEDPDRGDDLRHWLVAGIPTYWKMYSRNKKSVTLNTRTEAGRQILLKLVLPPWQP